MRGGRVGEKGRGKRRSMWLSECGGRRGRGCLQDCDVSESTKKEERSSSMDGPSFLKCRKQPSSSKVREPH
jgi:hypothetical protein